MAVAAIVLVALLAHIPALNAPFLWDDFFLIFQHPIGSGARPLAGAATTLFWLGAEGTSVTYFRPIVTLSIALDHRLFGSAPAGFHLVNIGLHALASALVFFVARRAASSNRAALLAAALFATMPRLTESVAWVSGRTDVLATLFILGAVLAHQADPRPRWFHPGVTLLCLCGLLCKEVAVVTPALLLAWDLTRPERPPLRSVLLRAVPALTAVLLFLPLRVLVAGDLLPASLPAALPARVLFVLRTAATYAWMIVTPTNAAARIGMRTAEIDGWAAAGALLLMLLAAWAVRAWRRDRESLFGPAWAALALAPVLNFAPAPTWNMAADRFLYLPAVGLAVVVARRLAAWMARAPTAALAAGGGALAVFTVSTAVRSDVYTDEIGYWKDAAAHAPAADAAVYLELGRVQRKHSQFADALQSLLTAADKIYQKPIPPLFSCELGIEIARSYSGLGKDDVASRGLAALREKCGARPFFVATEAVILARKLDLDGAARLLAGVLPARLVNTGAEHLPERLAEAKEILAGGDPAAPLVTRARALGQVEALVKAERVLRKAIVQGEPGADVELGRFLIERDRHADAASELALVVAARPDDPLAHYWLGYALVYGGREQEGHAHLRRSLELDPQNPNRAGVEKLLGAAP